MVTSRETRWGAPFSDGAHSVTWYPGRWSCYSARDVVQVGAGGRPPVSVGHRIAPYVVHGHAWCWLGTIPAQWLQCAADEKPSLVVPTSATSTAAAWGTDPRGGPQERREGGSGGELLDTSQVQASHAGLQTFAPVQEVVIIRGW